MRKFFVPINLFGFVLFFAGCLAFVFGIPGKAEAQTELWPENGHYYYFDFDPRYYFDTWDEAQYWAESFRDDGPWERLGYRGHLLTINSAAEQAWVEEHYGGSFRKVWIGAYQTSYDDEPTGNWAWVTGEPWSYENWGSGSPSNSGDVEHWAIITMGSEGGGFWDDQAYDAGAYAIIELEAPAERSTVGIKLKESQNNGLVVIAHFKVVEVDVTSNFTAEIKISKDSTLMREVDGQISPGDPPLVVSTPSVDKFRLELDLETGELTGKYKIFNVDDHLAEYKAEIQVSQGIPGSAIPIIQTIAIISNE